MRSNGPLVITVTNENGGESRAAVEHERVGTNIGKLLNRSCNHVQSEMSISDEIWVRLNGDKFCLCSFICVCVCVFLTAAAAKKWEEYSNTTPAAPSCSVSLAKIKSWKHKVHVHRARIRTLNEETSFVAGNISDVESQGSEWKSGLKRCCRRQRAAERLSAATDRTNVGIFRGTRGQIILHGIWTRPFPCLLMRCFFNCRD